MLFFNPSTCEAETGKILYAQGQPGLYSSRTIDEWLLENNIGVWPLISWYMCTCTHNFTHAQMYTHKYIKTLVKCFQTHFIPTVNSKSQQKWYLRHGFKEHDVEFCCCCCLFFPSLKYRNHRDLAQVIKLI